MYVCTYLLLESDGVSASAASNSCTAIGAAAPVALALPL